MEFTIFIIGSAFSFGMEFPQERDQQSGCGGWTAVGCKIYLNIIDLIHLVSSLFGHRIGDTWCGSHAGYKDQIFIFSSLIKIPLFFFG